MAIVKKRREFKVGLKPGYTLNGEIKEQQQDDNEVKYSNKKMEVTETYHQNGVIDNYHKKINEFMESDRDNLTDNLKKIKKDRILSRTVKKK